MKRNDKLREILCQKDSCFDWGKKDECPEWCQIVMKKRVRKINALYKQGRCGGCEYSQDKDKCQTYFWFLRFAKPSEIGCTDFKEAKHGK